MRGVERYTWSVNFFRRISRLVALKQSDHSRSRTTDLLAHLLYWLLPIVSALPLLVAWIGFRFVIAGTAPDEMDWDNEKHAVVGLMMVLGRYWAAAGWAALALLIYLWRKAPEVRIRLLIWLSLLIASGAADYDRRHPPVSDYWIVRGSAAFLLATVATILPIIWSGLLLRRHLARRTAV